MNMDLQTERLKLIPCTHESLSTHSTKEYELGPHVGMYLEELRKDSSVLGWGVWLVVDKQKKGQSF